MVVVPVLTLMGLSDEPADLEGHGPIDEDTARRLAARAPSFKRILTDPETGAILSYSQNTYAVPADLKRVVKLRDRTCRGPGCHRSARFCDLDHTIPYPRGGSGGGGTDEWNLAALCKPIHILKTANLWRDTQHRDGRLDWTSPAGKHYSNTPEGPLPHMRPISTIEALMKAAAKPRRLLRPLPDEAGGPSQPPAETPARTKKTSRAKKAGSAGTVDPWQNPPRKPTATNDQTKEQAATDDPDGLPPF